MIEELVLKYGSQVGIGVVLVAALVFFGRILVNYFIKKLDEKDAYIQILIKTNQDNTDAFRITVNHSQHEMMDVLKDLKDSIGSQTDVFKQLVKDNYMKQHTNNDK